jgi:aspartate carbamoyltransferase catalytic subunit
MSNPTIKHLVSSSDLTKKDYDELLRRQAIIQRDGISPDWARGKVAATLFFQPSTRTMNAFQSGMLRMGGGWIGVTGTQGISMEKGESFEDTIREYGCFADLIALRHEDDDSAERAAAHSFVPVLNCGSGSREHAVGTPWIVMMLNGYLGKPLDGLKVGIYGTPEINRATKSIVPILGMYGVDLFIDDLGHFPLPKEVEEKAKKNGLKSLQYDKLENFIGDVDILFLTRGLQKGIIPPDKFPKEKEEMILKKYKPITKKDVKKMKKDAILYMIKPRIFEVELDVDSDPRAVYAKQEKYVDAISALITYYLGIDIG